MKLSYKLIVPILTGYIAIGSLVHFLWMPKLLSDDQQYFIASQNDIVKSIIPEINRSLLSGDLATLHMFLDAQMQIHKQSWGQLQVKDSAGLLIYPFEEVSFSVNKNTTEISIALSYLEEELGTVFVLTDWSKKRLAIETELNLLEFTILFIFGVIIITGIIFQNYQIRKPLVRLTDAITELAKGDFNLDHLNVSNDEIGQLTHAFQQMIIIRLQAEKTLRRSEYHTRLLMNAAPDLIWLKDIDGVYLFCNVVFERFFGAKEIDIIGKTDYDFVDKELADFFRKNDQRAMYANTALPNEEKLTFSEGGYRGLFETIKTPVLDGKGKLFGVLGIARDITERRRLEERLQIHQHMDSIGTLAGGIAHDFNNILAAVTGNLELLSMSNENFNEKQKLFLERTRTSTNRAVELTKQFQSLSSSHLDNDMTIDIYDVVEEVFDLITETTNKLIIKEIKFNKGEFFITGNHGELHQVLLNLATNSIHSLEEREVTNNDYIQIAAESYQVSSGDSIKLIEGDYVHLSFKDSGSGMSAEVMKKAFEPMFTTKDKDSNKGQGLGLAMVYNIITKHHHGFIEIESAQGKGATFHIYLLKAHIEIPTESKKPVALKRGIETILVVDDDEMITDIAEEMLTSIGYSVLIANGGIEALKIYAQQMDLISAVILDLNMPQMSGKKVFEEMLKINHEVKVIISSGYGEERSNQGVLADARGNLSKPYGAKDLSRVVRDVLDS